MPNVPNSVIIKRIMQLLAADSNQLSPRAAAFLEDCCGQLGVSDDKPVVSYSPDDAEVLEEVGSRLPSVGLAADLGPTDKAKNQVLTFRALAKYTHPVVVDHNQLVGTNTCSQGPGRSLLSMIVWLTLVGVAVNQHWQHHRTVDGHTAAIPTNKLSVVGQTLLKDVTVKPELDSHPTRYQSDRGDEFNRWVALVLYSGNNPPSRRSYYTGGNFPYSPWKYLRDGYWYSYTPEYRISHYSGSGSTVCSGFYPPVMIGVWKNLGGGCWSLLEVVSGYYGEGGGGHHGGGHYGGCGGFHPGGGGYHGGGHYGGCGGFHPGGGSYHGGGHYGGSGHHGGGGGSYYGGFHYGGGERIH